MGRPGAPRVAALLLPLIFALLVALGTLILSSYVLRQLADRRLLRSVRGAVLDAVALREIVRRLRSDEGLLWLVGQIRRQHLDCTHDSLLVFDELMAVAEQRRQTVASLPFWKTPVHSLAREFGLRPSGGGISEQAMDEIARLNTERADVA